MLIILKGRNSIRGGCYTVLKISYIIRTWLSVRFKDPFLWLKRVVVQQLQDFRTIYYMFQGTCGVLKVNLK